MAIAEIFRALGDPVRLEMMRRLSEGRPHSIATVSSGLGITRQGARKHLQVLVDAQMVTLESKGRDVNVQLEPTALGNARNHIAELERCWGHRLEALRRFVEDGEVANE